GPALRISPFDPASPQSGPYADFGTVACSRFHDTTMVDHCVPPAGGSVEQAAIDGVAIRGWNIRDNVFEQMACQARFLRAIWIRAGSRDTEFVRNTIRDSNGGITLGD